MRNISGILRQATSFFTIYHPALNEDVPSMLLPMDRFVGLCALQEGLVKFGIGVSTELASELLLELGGAAHFTASNLASFISSGVSDSQVRVHSSVMRTQSHQGKKRTAGGVVSSIGESSIVVAQPSEGILRRQNNEAEDGQYTPYIPIPRQDNPEQRMICPAKMGRAGEETTPSELFRVRLSSTKTSPKIFWDELPCWARQGSRSALQELMGHHQR